MKWLERWKEERRRHKRFMEEALRSMERQPAGRPSFDEEDTRSPEEKERYAVSYRKLSYAMDKAEEGGPYPPGHVYRLGNLDDIEDPGEEYMEERQRKRRSAENDPS